MNQTPGMSGLKRNLRLLMVAVGAAVLVCVFLAVVLGVPIATTWGLAVWAGK
jgi:uncharacterized membrane protein